jgi:hypothetical protein
VLPPEIPGLVTAVPAAPPDPPCPIIMLYVYHGIINIGDSAEELPPDVDPETDVLYPPAPPPPPEPPPPPPPPPITKYSTDGVIKSEKFCVFLNPAIKFDEENLEIAILVISSYYDISEPKA